MGYTQEDLADGICSVPTLSRIENGERLPTKEHSENLLQRLGYSDTIQITYVADRTFELHELKYGIRQACMQNKKEQARTLLERYILLACKDDCLSKQFIQLYETLLSDSLPPEKQLEGLINAIRLTCPNFTPNTLPDFLSFEEITIINNIAIGLADMGALDEAVELLYGLKKHYDSHMVNQEEILRTQPMILYNLSKYLGTTGKFDECIEICDTGIRIARESGRCSFLDKMFYNKGWALTKRGRVQDALAAKECLHLAICMAEAIGQDDLRKYYEEFSHVNFGE